MSVSHPTPTKPSLLLWSKGFIQLAPKPSRKIPHERSLAYPPKTARAGRPYRGSLATSKSVLWLSMTASGSSSLATGLNVQPLKVRSVPMTATVSRSISSGLSRQSVLGGTSGTRPYYRSWLLNSSIPPSMQHSPARSLCILSKLSCYTAHGHCLTIR